MSQSFAGTSRLHSTYRSFVPPTTTDVSSFAWTATLLVGLLVGVVPVLALTTEFLPLVLVAAAGVVYGVVILATRTGFEGLVSAVVVFATFDVGVTLMQGPGRIPVSSLDIMAVDVVAVPLLIVFVYWIGGRVSLRSLRRPRFDGKTIAIAALSVFLVWTVLSAVVANGQSSVAPLLDTVQYLRYGLLFVLAAFIVRATNPWCVVYPLAIAVWGHLAFALAQITNRGGFGLKALGETPTVILGTFTLGDMAIPYGSYAGGFVGHSREFTIILLLCIPLSLAIAARHSWLGRLGVLGSTAAAVLVIRTADTDAGWAALLLTGVLLATAFGYAALRERSRGVAVGVLAAGVTSVVAAAGLAVAVAVRASAGAVPAVPLFDTRTLAIRIEQYVVAVEVAREYPLFGLGSGNFFLVIERFGLPDLRGIHGIVFSYLAATGFVGAAAYVLGATTVLFVAFRRVLERTGPERLLWGAIVCGMVGFHAYSLWDLAHLWDAALSIFWLLMGVVVGASPQDNAPGATPADPS